MPNVKIYVDAAAFATHSKELAAQLGPLRDVIIRHLDVPQQACQLALLSIIGADDQPALNVEMHIMPHHNRTRSAITAMGTEIQLMLAEVAGTSVAFRCAQLDPVTYVALK